MSDDIKVILLCGSHFALPALQEMAFFQQLAVVGIPDDCKDMIEDTGYVLAGTTIPVIILQKETFPLQLSEAIEKYKVNMGLVMTFSYRIPPSVYELPGKGFFNVHPGPLPGYRGPDPVFRQLKNKEKNAGVSIHKLDKGMDTGPVVITEMIRINSTDTHGLLTTKLSLVAIKLVRVLLKLLSFNAAIPSRPQNEAGKRYFNRQDSKDVIIDWNSMDAETIISLINACNPWNKGAITKINNKLIRLIEAETTREIKLPGKTAGMIQAIDNNGITVSTIDNETLLIRVIYMDEGFFSAGRLALFGVLPGNCFEGV